ncbi:MAG TPA: hypothetical protein PLR50_05075 [Candidatus Rifleibacterium sp.]|nr:hypothetical protein [Candidatus Rifleibacterium sp.]
MIDLNATNSEDINPGNDALAVGADQTGTEAGADNNADTDEFADLFDDDTDVEAEDTDESFIDELDNDEPEPEETKSEPEKAVVAEAEKPAAPASAALTFPPEIIPGTIEYIERIDREARELVKKQLGLTDENFDPEFDTKHRFALERATRQLDVKAEKFYEDKTQEIKQAEEANNAFASADNQIASILGSEELGKVFLETVANLPHKKVLEMQQKAGKGDYSSFINLATKIAQVKGKVSAINNRPAAPRPVAPRTQQIRTEITGGDDDGGVAGLLGL